MDESLGAALVAILRGNAGVRNLIDNRVFCRRIPQGAGREANGRIKPCVEYGSDAETVFENVLNGSQCDAVCTCPVNVVASTDAEAKGTASAVRVALHRYRGVHGGCTIRTVIVASQKSNPFEPGETGGDAGYFIETLTVVIHHTLTAPVET